MTGQSVALRDSLVPLNHYFETVLVCRCPTPAIQDISAAIKEHYVRYASYAILLFQASCGTVINIKLSKFYVLVFLLCCAEHGRKSLARPSPISIKFIYLLHLAGS